MSRHSDSLSRVLIDVKQASDGIDVALARADAWSLSGSWLLVEGRGGSGGTAFDQRERKEERKTVARATQAVGRIPHLVRELEAAAKALRSEVAWLTAIADTASLPDDTPACKNCAKTQGKPPNQIGGHFAEVRPDAKKHQLCDWCYRHALADGHERGLEGLGDPPPVVICEIYHTKGKRVAGLQLSKMMAKKAS